MLTLTLSDFTLEHFMQHYWQQKPVVIRQGFKQFKDLISPEELAGLACESDIESRLVYKKRGKWQAESGPFESYDHLYDVFICQGSGRRQWRVGDKGNHRQFAAHAALLHVDPFEAMIDVELLPGDILYIPPGFPHDGVSLETSMSFSVGFRAKSACDMLSGLADYVIDKELGNTLLSDPGRPIHKNQGQINASDFALIKAHLRSILDDDTLLADFAGSFLSRTKCQLDLQALDEPLDAVELIDTLQQQPLVRTGGLRCFYLDETLSKGVCYIDGERHAFGTGAAALVRTLCDHERLGQAQLQSGLQDRHALPPRLRALPHCVACSMVYPLHGPSGLC